MAVADTEFLYASALLRAMEGHALTRERFERMADTANTEELYRLLEESGIIPVYDEGGARLDLDRTLDAVNIEAARLVRRISPVPRLFDFLLYPYDAGDIKTCIKASFSGADTEGMLFSCGTLETAVIAAAVSARDFSALPDNMAHAAAKACEDYSRTGDPQTIDLPIDRACFADMLECTKPDAYLTSLVRLKTDIYNIRSAARVARMPGLPAPRAFLSRLLADGGNLKCSAIADAAEAGIPALAEYLSAHGEKLIAAGLESGSAEKLELSCDNRYTEALSKTKFMPFGAAVLACYAGTAETAAKNIRIICTMKSAGIAPEKIRERLRACNV